MQELSDEELSALTARFKERLAAGESLDALLPEAFAAVREASFRTLGLRHFDVQLIGGMALHEGQVAEMRTPLVISGGTGGSADTFRRFAAVMPGLREGFDFEIDEAKRIIAAIVAQAGRRRGAGTP